MKHAQIPQKQRLLKSKELQFAKPRFLLMISRILRQSSQRGLQINLQGSISDKLYLQICFTAHFRS